MKETKGPVHHCICHQSANQQGSPRSRNLIQKSKSFVSSDLLDRRGQDGNDRFRMILCWCRQDIGGDDDDHNSSLRHNSLHRQNLYTRVHWGPQEHGCRDKGGEYSCLSCKTSKLEIVPVQRHG